MIIAVPKNTLSANQKQQISKKGLILIECDEPEKIRVINSEVSIDTNDFFMAALRAMTTKAPGTTREHFINDLYERLSKKEINP